jgi:hypothetical protein
MTCSLPLLWRARIHAVPWCTTPSRENDSFDSADNLDPTVICSWQQRVHLLLHRIQRTVPQQYRTVRSPAPLRVPGPAIRLSRANGP